MKTNWTPWTPWALMAVSMLAGCGSGDEAAPAAMAPDIEVQSSDPAMVTGGDAMVSVSVPEGASRQDVKVALNGRDVTSQLQYDSASRSLRGLLAGFNDGPNQLSATHGGKERSLTVTNHPIGGPLFSGPQLQPWVCTTAAAGLGAPLDAQCNVKPQYRFFYKSVATGTFQPYDVASPPAAADVATATTDKGVTGPYVVRVESGSVNRSLYEIAVLIDPSKPWTGLAPQATWNGKVYIPLQGGFGHAFSQSRVRSNTPQEAILNDMALKRGFIVTKTTFLQAGTNMDWVRGAESLMMLKEHIRETYGTIRYTFSSGPSGGSMMQNMVANNYPGLLQGIIPMAEYADYWSTGGPDASDCIQLKSYFDRSTALWTDASQRAAVYGHVDETTCRFYALAFPAFLDPTSAATGSLSPEVTADLVYDPVLRPKGARGTQQDYQVNYLGRRPQHLWTAAEQAAGFGFGLGLMDNVGVQYGLKPLLQGRISAEQFVDLNERVGGLDIDFKPTAARHQQDPEAAARAYRMGFINDARQLDQVAIISVRRPDVDLIASHSVVQSFIYRDRLEKAGRAAHHALWIMPGYDSSQADELSFVSMDTWLTRVEADTADGTLASKIVRNKPAEIVSGCWAPGTTTMTLGNIVANLNQCTSAWYPVHSIARAVAADGNWEATRVTKCQLKPLSRDDYAAVTFSTEQWDRLQAAFPSGVCDWSKPDAAQAVSVPWLGFSEGPGGKPLDIKAN